MGKEMKTSSSASTHRSSRSSGPLGRKTTSRTGSCSRTNAVESIEGAIDHGFELLLEGPLVSVQRDATLKVWNLESGELVHDLESGKWLQRLEGHSS